MSEESDQAFVSDVGVVKTESLQRPPVLDWAEEHVVIEPFVVFQGETAEVGAAGEDREDCLGSEALGVGGEVQVGELVAGETVQ